MTIRTPVVLLSAAWLIPMAVSAQEAPRPIISGNDQQIRQQEEARERERTVTAPGVRSSVTASAGYPALPSETPCFRIDRFGLDVPDALPTSLKSQGASALPMDRFAFAREWLEHYAGQCIGKQGLDILVKGLSQAILARGYVTTRVLLPEQDLSTGILKFSLIPGVVRHVRFADEKLRGTWKTAFPTGDGELLNLRDLEQGLEQMKRVSSQDVSMQIVPGELPGESDVVLDVKRGKPWTVVASVDNSGTRATGKLQGNLSLGIDNPLGLNDVFNIGVSQDLEFGDKRLGSHGWNGFYSIPWGYWTATLSAYTNTYYQQIAGVNQTFVASGNSKTVDFKLARVLSRSQNDVFGGYVRLSRRFGQSFIEDTEISQQRRNNTMIELGLTDRHYFGGAQFDGSLAYRQGVGGLGAQDDTLAAGGGPTYRFKMAVLDANLSVPFAIGKQPFRYVGTFHGQYTGNTLYYIDDLTIGSRYTVRGFDGETMLAAARGFYWRNELQAPIGQMGQALYAGLDYGRVWGPQPIALVGTQLAGAVIGVKGSVGTRFGSYAYDLFAGTPVYKPSGFPTARVTLGFQVTAQF
ncbi:hemolysin secretion/activation ShlB/FhaC/HecB family protein [Burkholderia thailandensis E254]|uniref:Outer membrane hemolysin activator protein n=1 Tax=Burkholderia thailandensis (strain ATCC 700388 / DSM 13276 / CCUG 48851 / CIP 106301 / E264) TaxID=271848 RepID=Q2SV14_BURTA|nr:ShlB/FhaC/HecB family hemolysin secretion/activation protein [Burkholderia thailandensis]ABC37387.1 outer membrane hemolysin activator protein [Burkholderia thailandensis E264]AHI73944.1 hemolysin secretion/activation ShlB/FhaC/HecB family protein [Burkholderia thailandensis 2002721723]AIP25333.1 hemolysin secretion/activation ShlB/FhaC/HecB family protein [Burkholderia thailandensis E264]AIT20905.1 hemolysin secretion/activation ShlB/FhaC/HecB family protein [Burkholderia thailandensis E254